jgi:hypothetical protein
MRPTLRLLVPHSHSQRDKGDWRCERGDGLATRNATGRKAWVSREPPQIVAGGLLVLLQAFGMNRMSYPTRDLVCAPKITGEVDDEPDSAGGRGDGAQKHATACLLCLGLSNTLHLQELPAYQVNHRSDVGTLTVPVKIVTESLLLVSSVRHLRARPAADGLTVARVERFGPRQHLDHDALAKARSRSRSDPSYCVTSDKNQAQLHHARKSRAGAGTVSGRDCPRTAPQGRLRGMRGKTRAPRPQRWGHRSLAGGQPGSRRL